MIIVKNILFLFLLCIFIACRNSNKQAIDLPAAKNDTFDFFDKEDDIPIPDGFSVDTIRFSDKKTGDEEKFILPNILGSDFETANKFLKSEIKRKASLAYLDSNDHVPVDSSIEVFGGKFDNTPIRMYRHKNLVSYGFLSIYSDTAVMRPFRKYFTINYDTGKKKLFYLTDYFRITTSTDSAIFRALIYGDVGNPNFSWVTLDNHVNFSFDSEYVYFYFDMFGELGNPMGLVKRVKKKYLNQFIQDEYK